MNQTDPIRAIPIMLGVIAIVSLTIVACSGPQPLGQAIQPTDEAAYSTALASNAQQTPAAAYLSVRASELGLSEEEALARDITLSTTKNPFDARKDPVAVSRGAVVYKQHCANCHGVNADGQGEFLSEGMRLADFHDFSHRFAVTLHGGAPKSWFKKISEGYVDEEAEGDMTHAVMPDFGDTLAREQIWLVITYLQSLDADIPKDRKSDTAQ
jgi:mono/diheme cytochrome c family protein